MIASNTSLKGLRVVEFGQWIAAPYCAAILADLGADVIKVEKPGRGDDQRHSPPFVDGESALFMQMNRNKRSIVLDMSDSRDLERARSLLRHADVVLNNFRAGALEAFGLGYEEVRKINQAVIYCAISGFGRDGPLANRPGMDLIAQAASGIMVMNRDDEGHPHRIPMAIADLSTGLFSTIGVLAAIASRERTGVGQFLDMALVDSLLAMMPYETASFLGTGLAPDRYRKIGSGNAAPYQVFATQDGWIAIVAVAQHLWLKLCDVLDANDLVGDPKFASNAARIENSVLLEQLLEKILHQHTTQHWMALMEPAGIPCSEVMSLAEILSHAHVRERRILMDSPVEGARMPATLVTPIGFSETPIRLDRRAPLCGEHTRQVLGCVDAVDAWPADAGVGQDSPSA
jgi:crotonobetainyl-CoA:carnitine CoA-transferase CaiB-like acyl-CoA transferase